MAEYTKEKNLLEDIVDSANEMWKERFSRSRDAKARDVATVIVETCFPGVPVSAATSLVSHIENGMSVISVNESDGYHSEKYSYFTSFYGLDSYLARQGVTEKDRKELKKDLQHRANEGVVAGVLSSGHVISSDGKYSQNYQCDVFVSYDADPEMYQKEGPEMCALVASFGPEAFTVARQRINDIARGDLVDSEKYDDILSMIM